jgi:cobalt-zinc-cadmium efflux system membrane fusion protein
VIAPRRIARALFWLAFLPAIGSGCRRNAAAPATEAHEARDGGAPRVRLTEEGMKNAGVEIARLTPTAFSPRLRLPATITGDPRKIAQLGARVSGRVAAIRVKLGDSVRRGQPLVDIDGVEVHQVSLDYLSSAARLRAAEDALARQKQLVAERVGALADLRKAESEQAAAKAALDEASEHLQLLGFSASEVRALRAGPDGGGHRRATIRAPIDGRVAALDVTLGRVLTGDEPVVTVTQLDRVAVVLRVYERDVSYVRTGSPVEIQVQAYPGRVFKGTIGFVGDILDATTRTLQARVDLDNADGALKPGMTAQASVALPAGPQELWIPIEAAQPYERGRIAFVAVADRVFEPRPISVGDERGGFVPIIAGIAPGTPVAVRGALALRGELERGALEED